MKKIGVLLSGNGVFDGAEIHESVLTLLAIAENSGEALCMAPDMNQYHVLNHITGEELNEQRNVLVEAARITRGNIMNINDVTAHDIHALIIPGGFGAAKNLTQWAVQGPEGDIHPEVKRIIIEMLDAKKPIGALCMGPTVIARAAKGTDYTPVLTVGTTDEPSPYDIAAISDGMQAAGALAKMKTVREICVDSQLKIVSAPCYMMEADILSVRNNIKQCIDSVFSLI